jgi:hypothetical protein
VSFVPFCGYDQPQQLVLKEIPMSKPKYLSVASIPVFLLAGGLFSAAALFRAPTTSVVTVNEPLENIRFTVYDVGIYPQEMEVNAGRLGIVFDDRTGRSSSFLVQRFTDDNSEVVGQINVVTNHSRTRGQVKLTPGRYKVFDSTRPEMYSTLTVNP